MKYTIGTLWALYFFSGIIVGNSPALLDLIPTWLLIALWCAPWAYVAARYRKEGNSKSVVQRSPGMADPCFPRGGLK